MEGTEELHGEGFPDPEVSVNGEEDILMDRTAQRYAARPNQSILWAGYYDSEGVNWSAGGW